MNSISHFNNLNLNFPKQSWRSFLLQNVTLFQSNVEFFVSSFLFSIFRTNNRLTGHVYIITCFFSENNFWININNLTTVPSFFKDVFFCWLKQGFPKTVPRIIYSLNNLKEIVRESKQVCETLILTFVRNKTPSYSSSVSSNLIRQTFDKVKPLC